MAVVDIEGALAALARDLGQAERPRCLLARVRGREAGQHLEPGLHDLRMDHGVEWPIERYAGAQTSERPESVGRHRRAANLLEQHLRASLLALGVHSLQRRGGAPHLGQLVWLRLETTLSPAWQQRPAHAVEQGAAKRADRKSTRL